MKIIIVIVWIASGIITAGANNAYFRNAYPTLYYNSKFAAEHCGSNFVTGLGGPISLIVTTFTSSFFLYGLDYSCKALPK